jgi:hypothetical protein
MLACGYALMRAWRIMGTGFGGLASRLDMHLVSRCQWQLESYEQDLAAIIVVSRCMNL